MRSIRFPRTFTLSLLVSAVAVAAVLCSPSVALAKKTVGLSSAAFDFSVSAGGAGNGEIVVMNSGDEPIKVMVYTTDRQVDQKGKVKFVAPTRDTSYIDSPASWVRLQMPESSKSYGNTPYLELKPGERIPVKFTFQTPADARPGDHSLLLFFEMFEFRRAADGAVSQVSGRLGTRIRMRVQGDFVERLDIRPFAVKSFVIGNRIPWVFTARNAGNIDKMVNLDVVMLDGSEQEVMRSHAATATTLYAGTVGEYQGELMPEDIGLGFGRYTVRAMMAYAKEGDTSGLAQIIHKDRSVILVPLWAVITAGASLGLLLLWGLWKLSVRSALRRFERQRARDRQVMLAEEDEDENEELRHTS